MGDFPKISLAAARVNANMTQDDVSKIMHKSKKTIVNWEKGVFKPDVPSLDMLSRLYNIPIDYLKL